MRARALKRATEAALLLALIGALAPPTAAQTSIVWRRLDCPPASPAGNGAIAFTCGHRDGTAVAYQVAAEGQSLPEPPTGCTSTQFAERPRSYSVPDPSPPVGAPVPCQDGVCLCEGEVGCRESWVAVVDWNSWHGWTISSLIRSISSAEVVLFDLDPVADPSLSGVSDALAGVTDLQVLARLCEVVEEAESTTPPLAVNLSFGRLPEEDRSSEPGGALSREIERVLDRLSRDHGIPLLASAGNHRRLLFPASHDAVTAVGALALAKFFHKDAEPERSWETPPGPSDTPPGKIDALFPGNGLCLPVAAAEGETSFWQAPPGTSYATGWATGWLALAMRRGLLDGRLWAASPALWHPIREPGSLVETYLLARGGSPIAYSGSSAVDDLLNALQDAAHPCWQPGPTQRTVRECHTCTWGAPPSLDEFVYTRNVGTPSTLACVPCTGIPLSSGNTADPDRLVVNLSATPPFSEDIRIKRLQLRIGDTFHLLRVAPVRDLLQDGGLQQLIIEGLPLLEGLPDLSLRFRLHDRSATEEDDKNYWTSVPILVLHQKP